MADSSFRSLFSSLDPGLNSVTSLLLRISSGGADLGSETNGNHTSQVGSPGVEKLGAGIIRAAHLRHHHLFLLRQDSLGEGEKDRENYITLLIRAEAVQVQSSV